jgi:hypothetical protein
LLLALALTALQAAAPDPLRIVFLAGSPDDHPAGTDEYESAARLLAHGLAHASNAPPVATTVVPGGWRTTRACRGRRTRSS